MDERETPSERDLNRKLWLYAVLGFCGLLWGLVKVLSVYLALTPVADMGLIDWAFTLLFLACLPLYVLLLWLALRR